MEAPRSRTVELRLKPKNAGCFGSARTCSVLRGLSTAGVDREQSRRSFARRANAFETVITLLGSRSESHALRAARRHLSSKPAGPIFAANWSSARTAKSFQTRSRPSPNSALGCRDSRCYGALCRSFQVRTALVDVLQGLLQPLRSTSRTLCQRAGSSVVSSDRSLHSMAIG